MEHRMAYVEQVRPFPPSAYREQILAANDPTGNLAFSLTHVLKHVCKSSRLLRKIRSGAHESSMQEVHELVRELIFDTLRFAQLSAATHAFLEAALEPWELDQAGMRQNATHCLQRIRFRSLDKTFEDLNDGILRAGEYLEPVDHQGGTLSFPNLRVAAQQLLDGAVALANAVGFTPRTFDDWLMKEARAPHSGASQFHVRRLIRG